MVRVGRYKACGDDEKSKSKSSKWFEECKSLAAHLSGSYVGAIRNEYKAIVREGNDFAFS